MLRPDQDGNHTHSEDADSAVQAFRRAVESLPRERPTVIALDEVEHIAPRLRMEPHWDREFLDFWKTLRAIQNENRHLTFIVAGVNASAIETPTFGGFDNPLFSMAQVRYMPAFDRDEIRVMVRTLGRHMGLRFEEDVYTYLMDRYGGHPSITRMVCSYLHKKVAPNDRPINLSVRHFLQEQDERERGLLPIGEHILGLLKSWYPDEHTMLEFLAAGDIEFFAQMSIDEPSHAEHLRAYELVSGAPPRIRIPLLETCLRRTATHHIHAESAAKSVAQVVVDSGDLNAETAGRLASVGAMRNRLEPLLRRYIKRILKAHLGPDRWIDPVLKAIPEKERERLQGVDRDRILSERLYLQNLVTIVDKNWELFKGLEACPPDRQVTKEQVKVLLTFVNTHREDAHAKDIAETELLTLKIVADALEGAIKYMLED